MEKKILEYIRSARSVGMTDTKIREELAAVGWTPAETEAALRESNEKVIRAVKVEKSSPAFRILVLVIWAALFFFLSFFILDRLFGWGMMN